MGETNFKLFEIQIGDIWNFEKKVFLSTRIGIDHILDLQKNVKDIIIDKGEPFLTYQEDQDTYNEQVQFIQQSAELKDSIRLSYFASGDSLFYYNQKIQIPKEDEDFDFWFVLKLSQYHERIKYIDVFLKHHLEYTYANHKLDFHNFLVLLLRQYKNTFLTPEIFYTCEEFMEQLIDEFEEFNIKKKPTFPKKTTRPRMSGTIKSFSLKILKEHPDYFERNKHIYNVFYELVNHGFIHQDTEER
ncbi:hypothetical protein GCM10022393_17570 [Aquimarina addita]|uniref:Uncharacterized protein n=1 Tax=Aquimarina addita TaxID=870485 RepID=A0ABP7XHA4_9FLAO